MSQKLQQHATCVALGPDLRDLFAFGRRLANAGQRPVLVDSVELASEVMRRTDLQVLLVATPNHQVQAFVQRVSRRLLEKVPNARLVFETDVNVEAWTGLVNNDVVYFVEPDAPPSRLKGVIDMATFSDGLMGSINNIDLLDFLQLLIMKRGSTAIAVRGTDVSGLIVVEQGDIVDARCGNTRGNDALVDLLGQDRGHFAEVDPPAAVERTVIGRSDAVILEAMRVRDERGRNEVASGDSGLQIDDILAGIGGTEANTDDDH